jgi:DNA polymerase (family X)
MSVQNSEVARIFDEYADLLEIYGANEYRVRAYRSAARNISYLSQNLNDMVKQGEDLTRIPGIADDLAGKITQIIKTRHLSQLDELKKSIPPALVSITHIAGLGPKRAHRLFYEAGISSVKDLENAARAGKIKDIPGFGIKIEKSILADIEDRGPSREGPRILYSAAENLAQPLLAHLAESTGITRLEAAGGFRRGTETVGSLNILAAAEDDSDLMDRFVNYDGVEKLLSRDRVHSAAVFYGGLQVELNIIPSSRFGMALFNYTGSRAHCDAIRRLAARRRLKINEFGVFKGEELIAGQDEDEIYSLVNTPFIEPELRENRGEVEAGRANSLPQLLNLKDIHGDLHVHTDYTDGRSSLEEMARAAQEKGYEYMAITEHSQHLTVAHGLNSARLAARIEAIDNLNRKLSGIKLLKSIEVDILEDGSLDLPDKILSRLDFVVCAVHHKFNLSREQQTERIIRAINHPYFMILAHPTGRLINDRDAYDVDMERLIRAARQAGCILELNAQPERLDLDDVYCKRAKELGVKVSISSDAHSFKELDFMHYGVIQARRGWLETGDVINTLTWAELKKTLDKSRAARSVGKNVSEVSRAL